MRFLIWTWRVVLAVTVGAFVATAYYILHGEPSRMESSLPTLNLITVVGAALLGIAWTISRHYWHTLILLVALGVLRGLFDEQVLTEFQGVYVLVSIGVVGFVFVVALTARALSNDRAIKAARAAASASPVQSFATVAPALTPTPVAVEPARTAKQTAVSKPAVEPAGGDEGETAEPTGKRS
jgi:hypothetical protein